MSFFAERLGLRAPIIQAPMAGVQDHRLAAAVCQAGGLGSLPAAMLSLEALHAELSALRAATTDPVTDARTPPFNVNFFCHHAPEPDAQRLAQWHAVLTPYYQAFGLDAAHIPTGAGRVPFSQAAADVLEAFKPAVVSFHFGLPAPELVQRIQSWGSLVVSSATTVQEALWLQARGVDAVIAQGLEAGGHRGMFLSDDLSNQQGTFDLLGRMVQAVRVPVIAAGGIADAAGVAKAKALGAAGVQMGTAFLCTPEANTSALHRAALQSPAAEHTALTHVFTGRPARGIENRLMRELGPLHPAVPAFPLATAALAPLRAAAEARQCTDFTPLWAGQNAALVQARPAPELTELWCRAWLGA